MLLGFGLVSCVTARRDGSAKQEIPSDIALSPEQQRRYDYFFVEASRLKIQKEYAAAFEMLQHALTIHPTAASAHYELANYYLSLKQVPQAQQALATAVKYAPDNYWYAQALATIYQQTGNLPEATQLQERMSEHFPDKLDPLYALLDLYNRQKQYQKVIDTLNRIEKRTGKTQWNSMQKYQYYLQLKETKQAFHEIESLVAEYPQEPDYRVVLGDAYLRSQKPEEARANYQKALSIDPDNALALYSMASYYEQTGQKERYQQQLDTLLMNRKVSSEVKTTVMRQFILDDERTGKDSLRVIRLFDQIMKQDPDDADLPLLYAQYLLSKGMNAASVPVLQQVLDIDPSNTAARMTLLGEAVRKEEYPTIITLCQAGIEANPEMPEYYFYLAIAYTQSKQADEALKVCRKALTALPDDTKKEVVSDLYSIMGDAYHTLERNDQAYAAYDSALVYNPQNIGALNNYAYYLSLQRRDLDKAEEMSYRTVKAEPNNATYLDTYAWILFEKGNYDEARIYIDNALLNNNDKSGVIIEHCGDIYFMTGDVEGALKYWRQALEAGSESETLKEKIVQKKYIPQ
ncbi:MAG: tetratricopeptide repeat protein [Prevotellaceae bacterium]|jgi:tetratricopeptide (TPR) repeat protein|nr:tetratricopeptide repeat protein [Prevotellaceae bacterium]